MYLKFIKGNEYDKLLKHYEINNEIYKEYIKNVIKAQKFARVIMRNRNKKVTNCGQMAKRLLMFSVKDIREKITENLMKMRDFLVQTYSGFYCTICNYENRKYFNKKKMEITFSKKFCRRIVD